MKIAIVGAGFSGLTAALSLAKKGHKVFIFEKNNYPGGLVASYKEKGWNWSLEYYYHHLFENDKSAKALAKKVKCSLITLRPKTSTYIDNSIYQLDSIVSLIKFPKLSLFEKLRMGICIALLRYNPFWKPLEKIKASEALPLIMGRKGYSLIWEPLFNNKFKNYRNEISLAWFWARIKKRTPKLLYPVGGFLQFINCLVKEIKNLDGKFYFGYKVTSITYQKNLLLEVINKNNKKQKINFDKVILTIPTKEFLEIVKDLPEDYQKRVSKIKNIGSISMLLRFKNKFLNDNTYWLNICDVNSSVMAIIEHTNFIDKKYYNNEHIVYVGNYFSQENPLFLKNDKDLLNIFHSFLKKINPNYQKELINLRVFKNFYTQPIAVTNYSKYIPKIKTPIKNIYLANMDMVYPWDRGINYAIRLGEKVAKICCE